MNRLLYIAMSQLCMVYDPYCSAGLIMEKNNREHVVRDHSDSN